MIEVTTNMESQKLHRLAAETDDLESYFCVCHCYLGSIFTLKQFKHIGPRASGNKILLLTLIQQVVKQNYC